MSEQNALRIADAKIDSAIAKVDAILAGTLIVPKKPLRDRLLAALDWQPQLLQDCEVCREYHSDVRLHPCLCETVCVSCMRKIVKDSSKPECPSCSQQIREIEHI